MRAEGARHRCRMWSSSPAAKPTGWRRRRACAEAAGADIIDINMGCPAKRVTGGYAGSALMRDLDHARRADRGDGRARSRVPVTLKMRLGWDERSLNAPELARRAEAAGRRAWSPCMAARAASSTRARPTGRRSRAVKEAVSIPVVANGDSRDAGGRAADAARVRRRCGDDRPRALGRPWLSARSRVISRPASAATSPHARRPARASSAELAALEHYETCWRSTARRRAAPCPQASRLVCRRARVRRSPTRASAAPQLVTSDARVPSCVRLIDACAAPHLREPPHEPGRTVAHAPDIAPDAADSGAQRAAAARCSWSTRTACIADANAAAENFFELGAAMLRRQRAGRLRALRLPALALVDQVRERGAASTNTGSTVGTPRIGGERIVDIFVAPARRSGATTSWLMLQERSMADKIDRQLTHRGAARSVTALAAMLAHEIKNPLSGIRGAAHCWKSAERRGSRADAADLRRDRPHREARRPHGGFSRRAARSSASRSTSTPCSTM